MPRRATKILSDFELGTEDAELYREITGKREPSCLHLRDSCTEGLACFPPDGYLSWEHRWFMGTGVRPKSW